jgi:hypothetical protein
MKKLIIVPVMIWSVALFAQTKNEEKAIIYTTMNIIAPEEEETRGGDENRQGMNFRNMMDGETKLITTLLKEKIKTDMRSESIKSTIYRDELQKKTTTIFEMMGNTSGYFTTDEEQNAMQIIRDSIMAERRKKDSSFRARTEGLNFEPQTEIVSTTESKKIAGFNCFKAYIVTSRMVGNKDTTTIWYTPEFSFENLKYTGGITMPPGMMGNNNSLLGANKVKGFVMSYEMKMRRNRKMEVAVTKIDFKKEITSQDFELPKDVEIKPMKEMQNQFGNGRGGMNRMGRE